MKTLFNIFLFITLNLRLLSSEWETISMPENDNGNKWSMIECYDDQNCIMVGYDWNSIPRVMVTTDAGKSWEYKLNRSTQDYINDHSLKYTRPISAYYDEDIIILSCLEWNDFEPYIIRSFDSGETWEEFKINTPIAGYIYFDKEYGIMLTRKNIYHTTDLGETWTLFKDISYLGNGFLKDYNFNSTNEFSFLLENNDDKKIKICKTNDMGETWNIIEAPFISQNMTYDFLNEKIGYVAGQVPNGNGDRDNAVVYKTIDGGTTWKEVLNKDLENDIVGTFFIDDIICIDENNAIIVGSDRLAALTNDGGSSWEILSDGFENVTESSYLSTIEFIEPNIVIGGGWDNLIARIELDHLTSIYIEKSQTNNHISPNPVQDQLIIENFEIGINQKIEIYNILSEKVLTANISKNNTIKVSHLTHGIYFIKIGDQMHKFVKE